jgi:hypothetical protein
VRRELVAANGLDSRLGCRKGKVLGVDSERVFQLRVAANTSHATRGLPRGKWAF